MKTIGIVGGGASGMMAAIMAIQTCHNHQMTDKIKVVILEKKDILGKKILSTGNGRCNLTNETMREDCFRSNHLQTVSSVLNRFGYQDTLDFFETCGLLVKSRGGYIYPRNDQAASVRGVLDRRIRDLGATVYVNTSVKEIIRRNQDFLIKTDQEEIAVDHLILSTGGKAAPKLGSDGQGYQFAKALGHSIVPVVPALVQLKAANHSLKKAAGVRVDGKVTAIIDGKCMASDTGEIQLTEYGISGIPVFQISRYIAKALYKKQNAKVLLDLFPEMSEEALSLLFINYSKQCMNQKLGDYLKGFLNQKLVSEILKISRHREQFLVHDLQMNDWEKIAHACKCINLDISETMGFDHAQVSAGGVSLDEIDPYSLESKVTPGLWSIGELLDVDGICGGYNLQWAWSTGAIAGYYSVKEYIKS